MKGEAAVRKTDTYYRGIIVTCHKINLSNGTSSILILTKCLNTTHYLKAEQNVTFQYDCVTDCLFTVAIA